MSFHDVRLQDVSPINYSFSYKERVRGVSYSNVLVARFDGKYRSGSAGAPDARLIRGITQAAVTIWSPAGLVLDLRQLHYEWGDEMDWVLGSPEGVQIPTAIVGSEKCMPAIATLLFGINTTKRATEEENVFETLDDGLAYVEARLIEKRADLVREFPSSPKRN